MRRCAAWLSFCFALCACVVAGCGGDAPDGAPSPEQASGKLLPKIVDVASLPKLEDPLPPQDQGRVEVAGPRGWRPMSRTQKYVARYVPKDSSGSAPPRVLITAADAPDGEPAAVTKDKLPEFEKYIQRVIDAELAGKKDVREPVRMIVFGDRPWARYVRVGAYKTMPVDRQVLKTVAGGRIYTVELQVYHGNLLDHRDSAYALAAGMKFLKTESKESLGDLMSTEGGGEEEGGGGEEESGEEEGGSEEAGGETEEADAS